jgi:hypothetical protein
MTDPDLNVERYSAYIPVSAEQLVDAQATRAAWDRWLSATPEERARWADDAEKLRAAERATTERTALTLDALLDKLGFSREYAEHLVQPYCYCGDGMDCWDYCAHARDEGLTG